MSISHSNQTQQNLTNKQKKINNIQKNTCYILHIENLDLIYEKQQNLKLRD